MVRAAANYEAGADPAINGRTTVRLLASAGPISGAAGLIDNLVAHQETHIRALDGLDCKAVILSWESG